MTVGGSVSGGDTVVHYPQLCLPSEADAIKPRLKIFCSVHSKAPMICRSTTAEPSINNCGIPPSSTTIPAQAKDDYHRWFVMLRDLRQDDLASTVRTKSYVPPASPRIFRIPAHQRIRDGELHGRGRHRARRLLRPQVKLLAPMILDRMP